MSVRRRVGGHCYSVFLLLLMSCLWSFWSGVGFVLVCLLCFFELQLDLLPFAFVFVLLLWGWGGFYGENKRVYEEDEAFPRKARTR